MFVISRPSLQLNIDAHHRQTPILTLGALWAGGIVSPANPLYTADELAFQLRDSRAKGLVTQPANLPTALLAAKKAGLPVNRILLLGTHPNTTTTTTTTTQTPAHFTTIRTTHATTKPPILPSLDLAFLVYSSGTTGLPKGVTLTHHNMVANLLQASFIEAHQWRTHPSPITQLGILPFFHIYGLTCGVLLSVYEGWRLVVLSRFDMVRVLQLIDRYKVTFMYVPPPVVLAFSKHPAVADRRYDLSSLRVLHSGAAPLSRELTERVWDRVGVPVKQGFGLSETSAVVCCQRVGEWRGFMGSVGRLVPNMVARIVDGEGGDVGEGEVWLFFLPFYFITGK